MARTFLLLSLVFLIYFISSGGCNEGHSDSAVEPQNMFLIKTEDQTVGRVVRETEQNMKIKRKKKSRKTRPRKNKKRKNKSRKNKHRKNKSRKNKHRKNKSRKNKHRKNKLRKNKHRKNKNRKNKSRKNKHRKNKKRKSKERKNKSRKTKTKIGSCTRQDDACLKNLVNSLAYERDQITNFLAQYNRIKNFAKLVTNKAAKKGDFSNSTSHLLEALGGNGSIPSCGGQRMARSSRNAAVFNYNQLATCSQTIENSCKIPANTYSSSTLDACNATFQAIKKKNKVCCSLAQNAACTCWTEALALVAKAKKSSCDGKTPSDAIKKIKTTCISKFSGCKKAEDASIGYIVTCRTCNVTAGQCDLTTAAAGAGAATTAAGGATAAAATTAAGGATAAAATTAAGGAAATTAAATTGGAATTAATTSGTAGCSVKCGVKKAGTKIVGGTEATVNEYPWMASLSMGCGGSVIADKWVLTAAHCFYNREQTQQVITVPGSVIITIGEHDTFSTSETSLTKELKADKIIIHPSYGGDGNKDHSVNDIALLRVPTPIDLKVYTPVCLPTQGKDYSGKKAWVYGWGTLSSGGSTPAKLQELEVTVVTDASAKSSYQSVAGETLTDAQLAVMVFAGGEAGKDACQGDSGGPFTHSNPDNNGQHELVGAVSWGLDCAQAGLPGAYTEVSAFRTWVDGQISSNGGAIFTC